MEITKERMRCKGQNEKVQHKLNTRIGRGTAYRGEN